MSSEWTFAELKALRHKAVEEYVRVGDDRESWQLDLRAVAVELDRALTQPGDPVSVETRAQRVAAALDTSDPGAHAARTASGAGAGNSARVAHSEDAQGQA